MPSLTMTIGARRAVQIIFFVAGSALSAWAPMVTYAQRRLVLSNATLGLVLLALGAGGLLSMPLTGFACRRFGSRRVVIGSVFCVPPLLPLLAWAPTAWLLATSLFAFGAAIGTLDVAMNTASVEIERASDRPLLSAIHALYSIGSLAGALVMSALLRADIRLSTAAAGMCAALWLLSGAGVRGLPTLPPDCAAQAASRGIPWRVLALGLLCFAAFVTEGAMLDWSAVYLQSAHGVAEHSAGFGYVAFALAMVTGRLAGDRLTARVGAVHVVRYGALLSAAGFGVAVWASSAVVTTFGFALVGLGAANVVPSLFGAAGRSQSLSAPAALAVVAAIGNAGTLTGPAAIGAIAARSSLGAGFLAVAGALCAVALAAPLARRSA